MEADLDQIRTIIMEFPVIKEHQIPVILQPEGLTENLSEYAVRLADLMERMSFNNNIDVGFWKDINVRWKDINVRVLPQVHRIAWMNRRQV